MDQRRHRLRDLPGERARDDALILGFVRSLRDEGIRGTRARNLALGRRALETFFTPPHRSEPAGALYSRRRERHASWQALRTVRGLSPSFSHLNACIRVLLQQEHLTSSVVDGLGFAHLKALLPLPHGAAKQALAERTLDQGLSVTALRALVEEERRSLGLVRRAGRPPISPGVRLTRAFERALARLDGFDIGSVSDGERAAFRAAARELHQQLGALLGTEGAPPGGGGGLRAKVLRKQMLESVLYSRENTKPPSTLQPRSRTCVSPR